MSEKREHRVKGEDTFHPVSDCCYADEGRVTEWPGDEYRTAPQPSADAKCSDCGSGSVVMRGWEEHVGSYDLCLPCLRKRNDATEARLPAAPQRAAEDETSAAEEIGNTFFPNRGQMIVRDHLVSLIRAAIAAAKQRGREHEGAAVAAEREAIAEETRIQAFMYHPDSVERKTLLFRAEEIRRRADRAQEGRG